MELEGEMPLEGHWVDLVIRFENVQCEIAMMRTPDRHSRLELTKFHAPAAVKTEPKNAPVNTLGWIAVRIHLSTLAISMTDTNFTPDFYADSFILTNPFYKGSVTFNSETYLGKHEPLVSAEVSSRVQSNLKCRAKRM
jgi:hypothetical protein